MLFNSVSFLIFLSLVLLFYFIIPGKWRSGWLLLVSLLFYMSFHPKYLVVIAFVTAVSYFAALWAEKEKENEKRKKMLITAGVFTAAAVLVLFKYTEFILDNLNRVLGLVHVGEISNPFSFVMPVGVSYFTFQVISYMVDVYKGKIATEKNFVVYALYVSFFPKIISGPIERGEHFLPQIHNCKNFKLWDGTRVFEGIVIMALGYFQKMVVADRLAIFTGEVFKNYTILGSVELFVAAAAFYIQLYTDFAGCINIAAGAAKIMGFTLTENFNAPFFSGSIREYWSRWHISLSNWLRDYIYIPLGGNRKGTAKKYRNLILTFLVSGLWHGANWQYVLWGAIHGCYQVAGYLCAPVVERINEKFHTKTESFSYRMLRIVKCWLLVCLAYVFFKVPTAMDGLRYLGRMFTRWNPWALFDGSLYTYGLSEKYFHFVCIAVIFVLLVDYLKYKKEITLDVWLNSQCIWFRWAVLMLMIVAIVVCGAYGAAYEAENFIYFQF